MASLTPTGGAVNPFDPSTVASNYAPSGMFFSGAQPFNSGSASNPAGTPQYSFSGNGYDQSVAQLGYNPLMFANDQMTQALAQSFGGVATKTNPSDVFGPPSANMIDFGGGYVANPGVMNQLIQTYGLDRAKQMFADQQATALGGKAVGVGNDPGLQGLVNAFGGATYAAPLGNFGAPTQAAIDATSAKLAGGMPTSLSQLLPGTGGGSASPSGMDFSQLMSLLFGSGREASAPGTYTPQIQPTTTTSTTPGFDAATPGGASAGFPNGPDQALANNSGLMGYLENIVKNGGFATDSAPAWQSMVDAMNRNNQQRFADLQESFGVSGNRFGSSFGSAATDYWNQAALNQNSLLGQMQLAAQEAARGRELSGAGTLAQLGQSGLSQLSSQDFQAEMQRQQQQLAAALQMFGGSSQAASQLAGNANTAGLQLLQNALTATQGLYGTENQAAMAEVQRQLALQQLGLSGANSLSNLWQSNLGLGGQLGQQQYTLGQNAINNLYQEFLRTQPEYSPLLSYLSQGAYANPSLYYPQFQPSQLGSVLGGIGGIAGALPGLINLIGGLFGGGG